MISIRFLKNKTKDIKRYEVKNKNMHVYREKANLCDSDERNYTLFSRTTKQHNYNAFVMVRMNILYFPR